MESEFRPDDIVTTPRGEIALVLETYAENGVERAILQYQVDGTVDLPFKLLKHYH